jgi:hypothetical protein
MRRGLWEDEGDEYGPGVDLVFSLFAVTVLLLGILGAGGRDAPPAEASPTLFAPEEILAASTPDTPPIEYRTELVWEIGFTRESEIFTDDGASVSRNVVVSIARTLKGSTTAPESAPNIMLIEVHAGLANSAELTGGRDAAMIRSMLWGEAFHRALSDIGLPPACVLISPRGATRSNAIKTITLRPNSVSEVRAVEQAVRTGAFREQEDSAISRNRSSDQKIRLLAITDQADECQPLDFADIIQ